MAIQATLTAPTSIGTDPLLKASVPARRGKIVVIEDSSDLRGLIGTLLTDAGYHVIETGDGVSALNRLRREPGVDLILLDLWLPTMDGWRFRLIQRADPELSAIPVVVLTADGNPQALAVDAARVIRKPFEGHALLATIAGVLSAPRPDTAGALVRGTTQLIAAAVGHEIANPISILIHTLEHARDLRVSMDEAWPGLEELLEQCWKMVDTLRSLRDLPPPPPGNRRPVRVAGVLKAAMLATVGASDGLEIVDDVTTMADEQVLQHVCRALLRNAMEALWEDKTSNGFVKARLYSEGRFAILEVKDRGRPIADVELSQMFDPRYVGRGRSWSAGLRLCLAREALLLTGGSIDVANDTDGVVARVRIPTQRGTDPHSTRSAQALTTGFLGGSTLPGVVNRPRSSAHRDDSLRALIAACLLT